MPWVGIFLLQSPINTIVMREEITRNWNNGTDFANWMTKHVAYKVLSEFWCWYGDVVKTVSRFTDDEHELAALDEVGKNSFDGLPLPSLDAMIMEW